MMRKLRERMKNKKGFTLVELIVVIVIIMILSAALVPNLLRYVNNAKLANCKADAATILSEIQADFTASQASGQTGIEMAEQYEGVNVYNAIAEGAPAIAYGDERWARYTPTDASEGNGQYIERFVYYDGDGSQAVWIQATGKWEVDQVDVNSTPAT